MDMDNQAQPSPKLDPAMQAGGAMGAGNDQSQARPAAMHFALPDESKNVGVEQSVAPNSGQVAAYTEALDEEWVNKAKDIVEQTKSDPSKLTKEFSKIKADYMRVRFSKDIKVGEDGSQ